MRETEVRHTTGTVQVRKDADGERLGGYALKFNRLSQNLGGFVERIAPAHSPRRYATRVTSCAAISMRTITCSDVRRPERCGSR